MTDTRKLSNDEVSALLDGLNDGVLDVGSGILPEKDYKKFVFGADDTGLLGDLYTLRLINERVARQLRNVLLPMLRFAPRISALAPDIQRFEDYLVNLDPFLSLTVARAETLKGSILVSMPARLVSILVNSFFGGRGDSPITKTNEFTPTEDRMIQIVIDGTLKTLDDGWREIFPVSFEFSSSEMNPAFLSFVEGSDQVVTCPFTIQLPFAAAVQIDVLYPYAMLKAIAPLLRSKIQRVEADRNDKFWSEHLEEALMDIQLSIAPRIAEPSMSLVELLKLSVGTVVEIPAFNEISLHVEGQPIFTGTIGERDGKMAVSLT